MTAIPHASEPFLDAAGRITRPWRAYLSTLPAAEALSEVQRQIQLLWEAVGSGGGAGLPASTQLQTTGSVAAAGTLADGLVILSLVGDVIAPGASLYYGTDSGGVRGWHLRNLASLADVDLTGLDDGDGLVWDATDERWESAPILINPLTAAGDLMRADGSAKPERLPVGTDGQVLTVVSGMPAWAASAASGNWDGGYASTNYGGTAAIDGGSA